MTLRCGIQRRHLPRQIVVPRPGRELVNAHRHSTQRRQLRRRRSTATVRTASRARGVFDSELWSSRGYVGRKCRRSNHHRISIEAV